MSVFMVTVLLTGCSLLSYTNITVISNGIENEPYTIGLHSGGLLFSASGDFPNIPELFEALPEIEYADDFEIKIEIWQGTWGAGYSINRFTLYSEEFEQVFVADKVEELPFPDVTGLYLLEIEIVFNNSISRNWSAVAYVFKIRI